MIPEFLVIVLRVVGSHAYKPEILFVDTGNLNLVLVYIVKCRRPQNIIDHGIRKQVAVNELSCVEGFHLLDTQAVKVQIPFVSQKIFKLVDGKRFIIIVPLGITAAHIPPQLLMMLVLHAFQDNGDSKEAGHVHH